MVLIARVSLLLLLSEGVVFIAAAGSPQRSARWDAFLSQPRPKRSVTSWEGGGTSAICILQDLTADDTLGRRTSGLLSLPQCQGCCGSCWAFAAAHTYTDHLSIATGQSHDQISAHYLTACITGFSVTNDNGCCGACFSDGFKFFKTWEQSQIAV